MNFEPIYDKLVELSIICGMNQRYDQFKLTQMSDIGKWIDIAVVVTTMLGLALAVAAYYQPKGLLPLFGIPWCGGAKCVCRARMDFLAVAASLFAAIAGVVLIVSPASENAYHFNSMFQGWSDLRQEVDSVIVDIGTRREAPTDAEEAFFNKRYRDLLAKKNALNAREPAPDSKLLEEFLAAEERSRTAEDDVKSDAPTVTEQRNTAAKSDVRLVQYDSN